MKNWGTIITRSFLTFLAVFGLTSSQAFAIELDDASLTVSLTPTKTIIRGQRFVSQGPQIINLLRHGR